MGEGKTISIEQLKSLIEINIRINESYTDPDAVLVSILKSAMRLVECESASILLVDKESNSRLRFMVALGPKGAQAKSIPVEKNSIAGWVVQHGESVIINDVCSDRRFNSGVQQKTNYITRNMIAFPMVVRRECIGVIELLNKSHGRDFTQDDLAVLELMGRQAGIAYQNADVFRNTRDTVHFLQDSVDNGRDYHTFVAKSPIILDLLKVIGEVAKTNSSVLIVGESGVGKELFAEQLHLKSRRNGKPFVRVSCAALSPGLLESELFGHVKGAYTSAVTSQKGRFEMADGGTLFLDEIGEMPLNLQAKLLRVLQEKKFERVGSSETISVDVRIVAATNRDLEEMVRAKAFRDDLYYRLNVLPLNIPPLRRRKEDIEPLALYFLEKYSKETKKGFSGFSSAALDALYSYSWPGNVRELENTVERACILGAPDYIQVNDLRLSLPGAAPDGWRQGEAESVAAEALSAPDRTLRAAVNAFKHVYVEKVLQQAGWNQTEASRVLGVQRTYVSKLISELGIRRPD